MQAFLILFFAFLTLMRNALSTHLDQPRWKSFSEAEQQCAQYLGITKQTLQRYWDSWCPDEPSSRKLYNCVLINLNAWDEEKQQIKDHVFSRFFIPSTNDCQFREHTQQCLRQNVSTLDVTDRLGRTYQTLQCYLQNSAGIRPEAQWIPYSRSEIVQQRVDCMNIAALSRESLLQFCQGQILTNPDYANIAYCTLTRSGLYNESTGFDLEKVYVQIGNPSIISEDTRKCIMRVEDQYCKEPYRLFQLTVECLKAILPQVAKAVVVAASDVLGNPPECVVPPSPRPNTQPCYNCLC